jgi:arylsulfatase
VELIGGDLAALPDDIDGVSFAPTLLGKPDEQPQRDYIYWEFHGYGGQQAVRMGDWKALRRDIHKGNTTLELYNLADDPAEQHNVADEHPDLIAKFEQIMEKEHVPSELFPLKAIDGK